jgi:hypothetical protein
MAIGAFLSLASRPATSCPREVINAGKLAIYYVHDRISYPS